MTVLMSLRRGTFPAILIVVSVLSTLIFQVARSDGQLVNELEIRLLYSYGFSYSVLSLIAISVACFTVRSQLDAKNIHLLTSYPVSRKSIFFGQGLGIAFVILVSEIVLLLSILTNAWLFSNSAAEDAWEVAQDKFLNSRKVVLPDYKSKRDLALDYAKEKNIEVEKLNELQWEELFERSTFAEQSIQSGKEKTWYFETMELPSGAEKYVVRFNFREGNKRQKVNGILEAKGINFSTYYRTEIEADQFQDYKVEIPAASLPEDGKFSLIFTNKGSYSTIVTRTGLAIEFIYGSFLGNLFKLLFSQFIHASVMIVVGMCAGLGMSFSVANFLVMMLYLMSVGEGVVRVVIEGLRFRAVYDFWDNVIVNLLKTTLWVTKGLQPPDSISKICSGTSIDMYYLLIEWLPATCFYGLIALYIAVKVFENKELDRIQV